MPFSVKKGKKGKFDIVKKMNGRLKKVGSSTSKKKAAISAWIRERESKD